MAEKRKDTKIGLSQNWLEGAEKTRYFTKTTLRSIPLLIWELAKFSLWMLFAYFIIRACQWIFDYPFPPVTGFWSGACTLIVVLVVKDWCQQLWSLIMQRKRRRINGL